MVKARKTMRHLKKKGKKGASKVGKSARRRTTKHQRRTRRRMKLRGGANPQEQISELNKRVTELTTKLENTKFKCEATTEE